MFRFLLQPRHIAIRHLPSVKGRGDLSSIASLASPIRPRGLWAATSDLLLHARNHQQRKQLHKMAGNLDPETEAGPASASDASEPVLPPLTAAEYRVYNRLSERMEMFVSPISLCWIATPHSSCRRREPTLNLPLLFSSSGVTSPQRGNNHPLT